MTGEDNKSEVVELRFFNGFKNKCERSRTDSTEPTDETDTGSLGSLSDETDAWPKHCGEEFVVPRETEFMAGMANFSTIEFWGLIVPTFVVVENKILIN